MMGSSFTAADFQQLFDVLDKETVLQLVSKSFVFFPFLSFIKKEIDQCLTLTVQLVDQNSVKCFLIVYLK